MFPRCTEIGRTPVGLSGQEDLYGKSRDRDRICGTYLHCSIILQYPIEIVCHWQDYNAICSQSRIRPSSGPQLV